MRYVTLGASDSDGRPVVETWPDADRDEFAPTVNEWVDEMVPVTVPEVVFVTQTTTSPTGSVVKKTFNQTTGRMLPDPSGEMQPSGNKVQQIADPGGQLRIYTGDTLLHEYPAGEWKSCSEAPPEWHDTDEAV